MDIFKIVFLVGCFGKFYRWKQLTKSQFVDGITGRHLFCTCRNAIMAIHCLELLYVASFAWIFGKKRISRSDVCFFSVGFRMATSSSVYRLCKWHILINLFEGKLWYTYWERPNLAQYCLHSQKDWLIPLSSTSQTAFFQTKKNRAKMAPLRELFASPQLSSNYAIGVLWNWYLCHDNYVIVGCTLGLKCYVCDDCPDPWDPNASGVSIKTCTGTDNQCMVSTYT